MNNLIKADIYKEFKKKSFRTLIIIIIFISFISVLILNKTYKPNNSNIESYKQFTKNEYKILNKHGNYEKYKEGYKEYKNIVNSENKINVNNNKVINILENKNNFLYFIGIIIIFTAYNSISYDYNNGTLKYIVLNKEGRTKLLLSKIMSIQIISLIYILVFLLTFLLFSLLKFNFNIHNYYKYIYLFHNFIKIPYLIYYILSGIIFIIPYTFMIVFTYILTIIFKRSSISLIISNIIYLFSLVISQFLITNGIRIIKYTFLPYLDLTYLKNTVDLYVNNMIFNVNINIETSFIMLTVYIFIGILLSIKLFKKDIT